MARALPMVKNAIARLIDELREGDSVAVFGFSAHLEILQDFTTEKTLAKQAAMRTRALGSTALFDAIARVARLISRRSGKKAIVVFTDGDDNSSILNQSAAIARAKKVGVPVYTVAQGEALKSGRLLKSLRNIGRATGGTAFAAQNNTEIGKVFLAISEDMQHTYMLAYKAPADARGEWRTIRLSIEGLKDYRIHGKEGYLPD